MGMSMSKEEPMSDNDTDYQKHVLNALKRIVKKGAVRLSNAHLS